MKNATATPTTKLFTVDTTTELQMQSAKVAQSYHKASVDATGYTPQPIVELVEVKTSSRERKELLTKEVTSTIATAFNVDVEAVGVRTYGKSMNVTVTLEGGTVAFKYQTPQGMGSVNVTAKEVDLTLPQEELMPLIAVYQKFKATSFDSILDSLSVEIGGKTKVLLTLGGTTVEMVEKVVGYEDAPAELQPKLDEIARLDKVVNDLKVAVVTQHLASGEILEFPQGFELKISRLTTETIQTLYVSDMSKSLDSGVITYETVDGQTVEFNGGKKSKLDFIKDSLANLV